jgi:hypothetical protein
MLPHDAYGILKCILVCLFFFSKPACQMGVPKNMLSPYDITRKKGSTRFVKQWLVMATQRELTDGVKLPSNKKFG